MATTYYYHGKLADFSDAPFPNAKPRLRVEPERSATSQGSILATKPVNITVAADGTFAVQLVATPDLTPPSNYILRCEWLDGESVSAWTEWLFLARIGGGNIADMTEGPATNVWYSESQPPVNAAGIIWINPVTGDVKEWI